MVLGVGGREPPELEIDAELLLVLDPNWDVDGRVTLVTYMWDRTRGVTELLPRYVTTRECAPGDRLGVVKNTWLYTVDVAVGGRPLSLKETGGPPSME